MADYDLQYQDTHIDVLLATANELKTAGYIYKGVATPSKNPGTPTERVAYLASEPGTYTNFGGIVITSGLYSLTYAGGTWTGTQMTAGSDIEVVQTTGDSTTDVMSQKAVTDELDEIDGCLYVVEKIIDTETGYVNNTTSFYSTESIGLVEGKTYKVRAFVNAGHTADINFYMRTNPNSTTVSFNIGTKILANEFMSDEIIWKCTDDDAQYYSCWTANKITARVKIRFKEIEIAEAASEQEFEDVTYEEVPLVLQQGVWGEDAAITANTARLAAQLVRVDGNFCFDTDDNYHFSVLYFDDSFTFVKYSNPSFWDNHKWKDSYTGYIGIVIRHKNNGTILPTAETGAVLYVEKTALRETYNMELGAINGGYNVDSEKGCRTIGKISINKGETIFITFDLAQAGGAYSGIYKYLDGENVGNFGALTINNGYHMVVTCDGTYNELRVRVLGSTTWTSTQASNSFCYVTRNLKGKITNNGDNIVEINNRLVERDEYLNNIIEQTSMILSPSSYNPLQTQGILTLMQFSDIHGDVFAVEKALEFKLRYGSYIHDVIHTGDSVEVYSSNLNPFTVPANGGSIINLIGNHDAWEEGTYDYEMTEQEVYDSLLADDIASWGVTYESGKTYYYKDYATQKIRVIFVDSIHWHGYVAVGNIHDSIRLANAANEDASAQKTWFEATLAGAKTAGYAVVCITHYSPEKGINFLKNTGFNFYTPDTSGVVTDGWFARDEIFDCVDTFISGGGKFMCWLMGHCHRDMAGTLVDHTDQFMIGIDRGGTPTVSRYDRHVAGTPSGYVFNVTTFDSSANIVKVTRLGNCCDVYMQSKKTLCYDLANKRIVYNT